jgi:non-ribosomal peptide synthetase component F
MSPADEQAESNGQLIQQEVAELAGQLSEAEDESRRRRLARQIASLAGRTGHATRLTVRHLGASGQWLTAQALEMAPKVPIRSNGMLRQQYPGLQTEQLADRLIAGAARASAGVGAAVGVVAAVPVIPTALVELGVETLALVAIELKLVAELHEVYGMPAPGSVPQRMVAYTGAWAERRGVRLSSSGLAMAVGSPLRRKLERRLLATAGKSTLALAPLLTGAMAGALIDHHETRKLGTLVRDDLRTRGQS